MKEITLENLLNTDEQICKCTEEMDEVLRQTLCAADTLNQVADLVKQSTKDNNEVAEKLKLFANLQSNSENANTLYYYCKEYFNALVWLVKNTTICEQVAAKLHDTLKFNVERAAAKMLQEIKEYDS